jgi:hypothetical protein
MSTSNSTASLHPLAPAASLPNQAKPQFGPRTGFLFASLLFLVGSIALLTRPLHWLLGIVPDDAFYYLKVARNLVEAGRSSFDGVHPTNGYHPLWMLLCGLCAALVEDQELLLRFVLGLGFAVHFACALLLIRGLRRVVSELWAWLGGAVWLLNPFPLILLMQGMEAPAYQFALVLSLYVYWTRIDGYLGRTLPAASEIPAKHAWAFGAALGLTFLARTEAIVGAVVSTLLIALSAWRSGHRLDAVVRLMARVGAAATLVAVPWLVFSWFAVGTVSQDSGAMKLLWASGPSGRSLSQVFFGLLQFLTDFWTSTPIGMLALGRHADFLAGAVAAAVLLMVLRERTSPAAAPLYRTTLGLTAVILTTGLVYGSMLGDSQIWHLVQPGLGWFLVGFCWAAHMVIRLQRGSRFRIERLAGVTLLIAASLLHVKAVARMKDRYPWQRDVHATQATFEALVPPEQKIGSFNAGIPGYFSQRTIVNLDGLVNHSVIPYWHAHSFDAYLLEHGIDYIIDEQASLDRALSFAGSEVEFLPLHSEPISGWFSGDRFLWKVMPVSGPATTTTRTCALSCGRP